MDLHEMIKEARLGDAAAQKCLFEKLTAKMLMLCRRYVKSYQDAEELMLDGFLKVFKNLGSFKYQGDDLFVGWVKKIMINECLMFMRKTNLLVIAAESIPDDIHLEEEALNNLSASEIFELITQLPPGYRIIFNLYEIDGMTHKEISTLLGISEGTSKSQLSKGKKLLQKMLLQNQNSYVNRKTP